MSNAGNHNSTLLTLILSADLGTGVIVVRDIETTIHASQTRMDR